MTEQLESLFSRNFETLCELGLLSLSGADGMMRCQLGHTREFLALGGDQLRQACRPLTPEAWQASLATRSQDAAAMARQYSAALSSWQAESMRLLEQQSAAANTLLKQAMNDAFAQAAGEAAEHRAAPSTRSRKGEHKLAA